MAKQRRVLGGSLLPDHDASWDRSAQAIGEGLLAFLVGNGDDLTRRLLPDVLGRQRTGPRSQVTGRGLAHLVDDSVNVVVHGAKLLQTTHPTTRQLR